MQVLFTISFIEGVVSSQVCSRVVPDETVKQMPVSRVSTESLETNAISFIHLSSNSKCKTRLF